MNLNQIHITFNSREDYRILTPILNQIPHKLYYFTAEIKSTGQKDEHLDFFNKNSSFLKEKIPNLIIIQKEVDYTDYIEIIQELSKIIKKEKGTNPNCEFFINIGTGSKITAIASTEAARLWNCKALYVHSTKYDPLTKGARHKGEMIIKYPPIFPAQKPMKKLIKVLKIIDNAIKEQLSLVGDFMSAWRIYKCWCKSDCWDGRVTLLS
ncbi:MAG: hypothetical protein EU529_13330 [Promethearchaeota archaeon]|nr:MAG: hypothetical protein EU529_13330 [Candidatus Lokiarchaeota archaeon]